MDVHGQEQNADGIRDVELIDDGRLCTRVSNVALAQSRYRLAQAVLKRLGENAIYPKEGKLPRG